MNKVFVQTVPTYTVSIFMAGSIEKAKELLRERCYPPNPGLCVTIKPCSYIYSGGEEEGFEIGLVNYPRFPTTPEDLWLTACVIAEKLIPGLCQWSALLVAPDKTQWITNRKESR